MDRCYKFLSKKLHLSLVHRSLDFPLYSRTLLLQFAPFPWPPHHCAYFPPPMEFSLSVCNGSDLEHLPATWPCICFLLMPHFFALLCCKTFFVEFVLAGFFSYWSFLNLVHLGFASIALLKPLVKVTNDPYIAKPNGQFSVQDLQDLLVAFGRDDCSLFLEKLSSLAFWDTWLSVTFPNELSSPLVSLLTKSLSMATIFTP